MHRRDFLNSVGGIAALGFLPVSGALGASETAVPVNGVMTVRGWIDAATLGTTLVHEHALANFQGYESWTRGPITYEVDAVTAVVLPRLISLAGLGVRTFIDATAAYLGRDPALLRHLSEKSGLNILTVTGNYAAFEYRFLPPWVYDLTPAALAARWIDEWQHGIGGTGVRPAFIKLGFNGGSLSAVEQKLIHAAAITHRKTGLTIGAHTGPAVSAFEQLAILEQEGIDPSAWIWIHAQNEKDPMRHIEAARRGAWVEFDGIDRDSLALHVELVSAMKQAGLLGHILISQDAGWYDMAKPNGGTPRSYEILITDFLPALKAKGFTDADVTTLLVTNPAAAFTVRPRLR
ncbi:phosphotriesterase-related protein [Sphingomonas sp. UYAg733]